MSIDKAENQSDYKKEGIVFIIFAVLFFIYCAKYSSIINLWGDEAYSLSSSEQSVTSIMKVVDAHSPAYMLFLKALVSITGTSYRNEMAIRLIHTLIFIVGLYFGYMALRLLFNQNWLSLRVIAFVMLVPSFVFYATNIRVYALLFCSAMAFIYYVLNYLHHGENFTKTEYFKLLISAFFLILFDFIGLMYYGLGAIFVINDMRLHNKKLWKGILLLLIPPALVGIFAAPIIFETVKDMFLLAHSMMKSVSNEGSSLVFIAKRLFNSARPFVELTNISFKDIKLPILQLAVYGLLLITGTVLIIARLIKHVEAKFVFVLALSYLWILTFFMSTSLTRIFLPAQFFMSSIIVYTIFALKIPKTAKLTIYYLLIGFSLFLAILYPAKRFNSIIPYRDIAIDTLKSAKDKNVNIILISETSLNNKSVLRYMQEENKQGNIEIRGIKPDYKQEEIPGKKFIFLSYMSENNVYIDPAVFSRGKVKRNVVVVKNYVELESLPFNSFWKKNIIDRAVQKYAYIMNVVE